MRNCGQLLYAETMSNPLMTVLDLEQFGQLGSDREGAQHERLTIVDATFSSPQLVKPIKHGIDIVIHSAYVYLLFFVVVVVDDDDGVGIKDVAKYALPVRPICPETP